MEVTEVNDWMYWTRYGAYDDPVLVVLADAPDEQRAFAEAFAKLGTHRVVFEEG